MSSRPINASRYQVFRLSCLLKFILFVIRQRRRRRNGCRWPPRTPSADPSKYLYPFSLASMYMPISYPTLPFSLFAHITCITQEVDNILVVVTRYFGGIHLGPDRFKHINQVARNALEVGGFLDEPAVKKNPARVKKH